MQNKSHNLKLSWTWTAGWVDNQLNKFLEIIVINTLNPIEKGMRESSCYVFVGILFLLYICINQGQRPSQSTLASNTTSRKTWKLENESYQEMVVYEGTTLWATQRATFSFVITVVEGLHKFLTNWRSTWCLMEEFQISNLLANIATRTNLLSCVFGLLK